MHIYAIIIFVAKNRNSLSRVHETASLPHTDPENSLITGGTVQKEMTSLAHTNGEEILAPVLSNDKVTRKPVPTSIICR